jgi:hypothetical protein
VADLVPLPPGLTEAGGDLLPAVALGPLLDRGLSPQELASSPFGQALLMMVQLVGDVHRDHLELVRSELEQIRMLNLEISAARRQAAPVAVSGPNGADLNEARTSAARPQAQPGPDHGLERSDPAVVHNIVAERLNQWERDRQARWRKILDLLVRP